jgi:hypothetical protein
MWRSRGGVFVPLHQQEALWLAFDGAWWKPNAVQVGVGGVNAMTGDSWDERLSATPQNYIVCPDQPWLDGINSGAGEVRQFLAMPLGSGTTVEGQLRSAEQLGGIQLRVYEPLPGRFPDEEPERPEPAIAGALAAGAEMGIGAGGAIRQKLYPDEYGIDAWDESSGEEVAVHILNSAQYRELTGVEPPPTSIDAVTYTEHGFPWFELYDESKGDVAGSEELAGVEPISPPNDQSVVVDPSQTRKIP